MYKNRSECFIHYNKSKYISFRSKDVDVSMLLCWIHAKVCGWFLSCVITSEGGGHNHSINDNKETRWSFIDPCRGNLGRDTLCIVCSAQRLPLPLTSPLLLQKSSLFSPDSTLSSRLYPQGQRHSAGLHVFVLRVRGHGEAPLGSTGNVSAKITASTLNKY